MSIEHRILIGVTGASGSIYAERLVQALLPKVSRLYLVFSETARKVVQHELSDKIDTEFSLVRACRGDLSDLERTVIRIFGSEDLFAPVASGSSVPTAMVVAPCSMGALARIAHGISSNLLERSADVVLKQRCPLILLPRETPLSSIHLRNMLSLSDMGAHIIPAMPGFYQRPQSIDDLVDFVVGRVLDALDFPHDLYQPWNKRMR